MLPTLAERLREQQAKTRSRPQTRQPWPMPTEPPTALLFQSRQQVVGPEAVATQEPTSPRTRTALAELLLLLYWAVLVLIDGALALASLVDRVAPLGRKWPGRQRQRITPQASSSCGVSDAPEGKETTELLQGCHWSAPRCEATL